MERIIVVIDRSGSMSGTPLEQAKNFGKAKHPDSVWAFDSVCEQMKSVDEISCQGGTRISVALRTVFGDMKKQNGYQRQQLYFITDAQDHVTDSDEKELIGTWSDLTKQNGAAGDAHFIGNPGSCKDFLQRLFGKVNVLSQQKLREISEKLAKHEAKVSNLKQGLTVITASINTISNQTQNVQQEVQVLETKLDTLRNDCKEEEKQLATLKQQMREVTNQAKTLKRNASQVKNKHQFDQFKQMLKQCKENNKKRRDCATSVKKTAVAVEEQALKLKENLLVQQRAALKNRNDAIVQIEKAQTGMDELDNLFAQLNEVGGDFGEAQAAEAQMEAENRAAETVEALQQEAFANTVIGAKVGKQMEEADGMAKDARGRFEEAQTQEQLADGNDTEMRDAATTVIGQAKLQQSGGQQMAGNVKGIDDFLNNLNLSHFSGNFKNEGIVTVTDLVNLEKSDLKDLGVEPLATRNTIWRAIEKLKL